MNLSWILKINGKNVYAESPNYNATPVLAARANMNRYVFRRNEGRNLQALGGRGYREYGNLSADEIAEQLGDIDEYWGISDRIRENEEEQEYEDWISSCEELEKTEWYPAKI